MNRNKFTFIVLKLRKHPGSLYQVPYGTGRHIDTFHHQFWVRSSLFYLIVTNVNNESNSTEIFFKLSHLSQLTEFADSDVLVIDNSVTKSTKLPSHALCDLHHQCQSKYHIYPQNLYIEFLLGHFIRAVHNRRILSSNIVRRGHVSRYIGRASTDRPTYQ